MVAAAGGSVRPSRAVHPVDLDKDILFVRIGSHGGEVLARLIVALLVITGPEGGLMSCIPGIQGHASGFPYIQKAVAVRVLDVRAGYDGAPRETNFVVGSRHLRLKGPVVRFEKRNRL